jgi:site-specific DNA recombinase
MKVSLYARVSSEAQEARGTIGSQLEVLRARIAAEGHDLVAEFCDDGYSGARLDRPGLDMLRDQAEAGAFEAVWCLSPDRLARAYVYQVLVLDELAALGVRVVFNDAPALDDDPQLRLLTQVQGVIAEYERAKIAERNRRGRLFRSRAGEVVSWKAPYGYRRVARDASGPARLEVFEPEAAIVKRIFDDYLSGGLSIRHIVRRLNTDDVPTPTGKTEWWHSTVCRVLRNEAYIGRVYYNQTETVPTTSRNGRRPTAQRRRPRDEWIAVPCPPIIADTVFEAAQRVSRDNSKWSPRKLPEDVEAWLLRRLVHCGPCGAAVGCTKMVTRYGKVHRYYWCPNHASSRVGGTGRCPERSIRSDALDAFVFEQVRAVLLRPATLHAAENAVTAATPSPDDELLGAELGRLERKLDANRGERRRLADLYQSGLLELGEVQRRVDDVDARHRSLVGQRDGLVGQRKELATDNRLRQRVSDFAQRAAAGIDKLTFSQRQQLMRLVVEEVRVTGWQVEIQLRIPLDEGPGGPGGSDGRPPDRDSPEGEGCTRPPTDQRQSADLVSSKDGLRSLRGLDMAQIGRQCRQACGDVPAVAQPIDQGVDGKAVAEAVQCGPPGR